MSNPLLARLTQQLRDKGRDNPEAMAKTLLMKRGHIDASGGLTAIGQHRSTLGNAGRAMDRASTRSGGKHPATSFSYNPINNQATLKGNK